MKRSSSAELRHQYLTTLEQWRKSRLSQASALGMEKEIGAVFDSLRDDVDRTLAALNSTRGRRNLPLHDGQRDGVLSGLPAGTLLRGARQFGMRRPLSLGAIPSGELRLAALRAGPGFGGDPITLSGVALPYDRQSEDPLDIGGTPEIYKFGCFAGSLQQDLRLSFNFSAEQILGRRSAGTARFYEQPDGLHFECVPPDNGFGNDLLASIERQDITGAAILGRPLKEHFEERNGQKVRVIEKAQLFAVAISSFSAFDSGITVSKSNQQQEAIAASSAYDRSFFRDMGIQGRRIQ